MKLFPSSCSGTMTKLQPISRVTDQTFMSVLKATDCIIITIQSQTTTFVQNSAER